MKKCVILLMFVLPLRAQFVVPEWRGQEGTSHAEWDRFSEASFRPNFPDVVADEDASITSSTGSAFITSSGNLYSFQAPIALQLDDTTDLEVRSVVLQVVSLGSGLDHEGARLIYENEEGEVVVAGPSETFVASEEELTGERGGIGTTYVLQWDLRVSPVMGSYSILLNAASTSLSIDKVSLDLAETFEKIQKPQPLMVRVSGNEVVVTWLGGRRLQSSAALDGGWTDVAGSEGVNEIALPVTAGARFFRLREVTALARP